MENSLEKGVKSFFDKPEGKVGKIFLVLFGIVAAIGLYKALPYIITLLTNTLHAMFLLGAVVLIIFLVTNKKVQNLFKFGFQMLMRYITGIFVELNPIAIIRIHIENLEKNHVKMNEHIIKLAGEIRGLERKINENKQDIERSLKIASSAKEKEEKGQAWIEARKAGRRRDGTIKLTDLLTKIQKIYSVLKKMYEVSGYVIMDLKDDVEQKEIEYKTIKQAHAALVSSMSILNGDPNERAMFELALEKMEEEVSQKLGTMDRFMDMSASLVTSIDIEQGIFAEDGMRMLEEYENGGFDSFFNDFGEKSEKVLIPSSNKSYNGVKTLEKDATTGKYF
jgi:phage shock protein A